MTALLFLRENFNYDDLCEFDQEDLFEYAKSNYDENSENVYILDDSDFEDVLNDQDWDFERPIDDFWVFFVPMRY